MQHISRWINASFPSYIDLVVHFDLHNDTHTIMYQKSWCFQGVKHNTSLPKSGYFLFKIWNHRCIAYEYIVLKYTHVSKALMGKCFVNASIELCDYVKKHSLQNSHVIMEILVNGEDKYMQLYPFMRSLCIDNNATPHLISILYSWLMNEIHSWRRSVVLTDFNYKVYQCNYDEYIFGNGKSV